MQDNLIEALRFCAAGKVPCSKCPFWKVLDPADCQIQIMLQAADELERLTKQEPKTEEGRGEDYTVTEVCPHCESEIEMSWSVKARGYKAFCPVCGQRLMLCDECQHREQTGDAIPPCSYDSETDSCELNRK